MGVRRLAVLTLAAAALAVASAAVAQQVPATTAPPAPPPTPSYPAGPDSAYAEALRESEADRVIHQAARSAAGPPRPVFAVIGNHLVSGQLRPAEPLLRLVDPRDPDFFCAPSQRGDEVVIRCSDGSRAELKLQASGCGGSRSGAPASLCIGLAPKYAARRLVTPAGVRLQVEGDALVLTPAAQD